MRMGLHLTLKDRTYLEELAHRKIQPTSRQKAQALLNLAAGATPERVAMLVGIKKEDLASLVATFKTRGLSGIGLGPPRGNGSGRSRARRCEKIEKTPGVCGGAARVAGTRIPVWQLVEARNLGVSEAQLLIDYPSLKAVNLVDAWAYADDHAGEIPHGR
jgi:uncharacterized protein (DUF433 family)